MRTVEQDPTPSVRRLHAGELEPGRPLGLRLHRVDQAEPRQVLDRKTACSGKRRRTGRNKGFLGHALDKKARPTAVAMAYLQIDKLSVEVCRLIRAVEADFQFRVLVQERGKARQQPFVRKCRRRPDSQHRHRPIAADCAGGL